MVAEVTIPASATASYVWSNESRMSSANQPTCNVNGDGMRRARGAPFVRVLSKGGVLCTRAHICLKIAYLAHTKCTRSKKKKNIGNDMLRGWVPGTSNYTTSLGRTVVPSVG